MAKMGQGKSPGLYPRDRASEMSNSWAREVFGLRSVRSPISFLVGLGTVGRISQLCARSINGLTERGLLSATQNFFYLLYLQQLNVDYLDFRTLLI